MRRKEKGLDDALCFQDGQTRLSTQTNPDLPYWWPRIRNYWPQSEGVASKQTLLWSPRLWQVPETQPEERVQSLHWSSQFYDLVFFRCLNYSSETLTHYLISAQFYQYTMHLFLRRLGALHSLEYRAKRLNIYLAKGSDIRYWLNNEIPELARSDKVSHYGKSTHFHLVRYARPVVASEWAGPEASFQ